MPSKSSWRGATTLSTTGPPTTRPWTGSWRSRCCQPRESTRRWPTRCSTALDGLDEMVSRLERAIEGDPQQDFAGPERVLALVRLRAPGWPTGPGDPDLGLESARRAVERFPDYPPNLLCLAEAWEATEQPDRATEGYRRALELARGQFEAGHEEARRWMDEAQSALAPEGR